MERLKRVLVVDDERILADAVARVLTRMGPYETRVVTDPATAVAAALEFRPDVLLLDIVMPGMDGGEVLAALRSQDDFADIPAVFLTGIVSESEMGSHGRAGQVPVVAKPVNAKTLLAAVAEVLEGR